MLDVDANETRIRNSTIRTRVHEDTSVAFDEDKGNRRRHKDHFYRLYLCQEFLYFRLHDIHLPDDLGYLGDFLLLCTYRALDLINAFYISIFFRKIVKTIS